MEPTQCSSGSFLDCFLDSFWSPLTSPEPIWTQLGPLENPEPIWTSFEFFFGPHLQPVWSSSKTRAGAQHQSCTNPSSIESPFWFQFALPDLPGDLPELNSEPIWRGEGAEAEPRQPGSQSTGHYQSLWGPPIISQSSQSFGGLPITPQSLGGPAGAQQLGCAQG